MVTRPTSARRLNQPSVKFNSKSNKNNKTLKKLPAIQSSQPTLSRMSTHISLNDLIIDGEWKFEENDNDYLQSQLTGIENLVHICYDIMNKTQEIVRLKQQKERISFLSCELWLLVKLDTFKTLTDADRAVLNRAHIYDLMTIVFEAVSTSTSISQLVRIWREISEHINHQECLSKSHTQLRISYENAFRHLIHTPDNPLLQIALHASLITSHSRMDLQELGEKMGVKRCHFDVGLIKDSTQNFQDFIKLLREQKQKQEREQQSVDMNSLSYKPKKKRGLNANVSGTKFSAGKLFLLRHFKGFFNISKNKPEKNK
jgi:hypothetical protein